MILCLWPWKNHSFSLPWSQCSSKRITPLPLYFSIWTWSTWQCEMCFYRTLRFFDRGSNPGWGIILWWCTFSILRKHGWISGFQCLHKKWSHSTSLSKNCVNILHPFPDHHFYQILLNLYTQIQKQRKIQVSRQFFQRVIFKESSLIFPIFLLFSKFDDLMFR